MTWTPSRGVACRPDLRVLVVNAGSSSLKLRMLGSDDELLRADDLPALADEHAGEALTAALGALPPVDAVGHRIVHGGERFRDPVRIDAEVESALRGLAELAPLHQSKSLTALHAVSQVLPDVPAVGCFDTAFHATIPAAAATYAIPVAWRERHALRRYGFHGLSHGYAARRAGEILGRDNLRIVTCHLGAGASLAAVSRGRCVDTTMGFTPLEGLVMATRSGSVDPGMLMWLLERSGIGVREMGRALEHESGLLALAGTDDMRNVLARDDSEARLAVEVYVHRLRGGIAAMAASLGGLEALAFTGGVGERAAPVRAAAVHGLGFLGAEIDEDANAGAEPDADISVNGAGVRTLVIRAREDLEIAAEVRALLVRGGEELPG